MEFPKVKICLSYVRQCKLTMEENQMVPTLNVWPAYSMALGFEEPPSLSSWAVSDVMVIATPGLLALQHGLWVMILQFWSSSVPKDFAR